MLSNLFTNFRNDLPSLLLSLPVLLIAFSTHEAAHGYVAYRLGDSTAKNFGRLTLNPIKHIDLMGFICMIFFRIGWAKPVPINARNFKKPRRDMALVGIAGPASNLCLGIVFAFLYHTAYLILNKFTYTSQSAVNIANVFLTFLYLGVLMNVCLAVFNMIPVPPFDGSRFIYAVLPIKWYFGIMKYERYIALAIFILLFTGILSGPISIATSALVNGILWLVGLIPIFS